MNPFAEFTGAWDALVERMDKLAARLDNGDEDTVKSMVMLRGEVYHLRSEFEAYTKRADDAKADLEARVAALGRRLDSIMGEHVVPTMAGLEGIKGSVRNLDQFVNGVGGKFAEVEGRLSTIEGKLYG